MFNYKEIADSCIKCGKCIPVCTIHQNSSDEVTSPRGFIELLGAKYRGDLKLDKTTKEIFESCFLCTNCVNVCPNSLPTDTIIEEIRYEIGQKYGIAWYKRGFFWLLRHRFFMDLFSGFGYLVSSCVMAKQKNGLSLLFDLPIIKRTRLLPFMKFRSFLNKYPKQIKVENSQKRVAIFIGCLANYNYTEVGDSLINILKKLEIDILIPKKQKCCGAPAYFTGDFNSVEFLIKQNVDYFETFIDEVDAIIIPEATCSAMIKHDWEIFLKNRGETDYLERVKRLNKKIFMATEWLYKETNLKELLQKKGKKLDDIITYHDPCHAKKVQGVYKEPRELLSHNYSLKEMSNPDICCGFGGVTIQTERFYLAQKAGLTKANMIKETKANIVSAECSACRVQISNSLFENGVNVEFKSPIELIDKALR